MVHLLIFTLVLVASANAFNCNRDRCRIDRSGNSSVGRPARAGTFSERNFDGSYKQNAADYYSDWNNIYGGGEDDYSFYAAVNGLVDGFMNNGMNDGMNNGMNADMNGFDTYPMSGDQNNVVSPAIDQNNAVSRMNASNNAASGQNQIVQRQNVNIQIDENPLDQSSATPLISDGMQMGIPSGEMMMQLPIQNQASSPVGVSSASAPVQSAAQVVQPRASEEETIKYLNDLALANSTSGALTQGVVPLQQATNAAQGAGTVQMFQLPLDNSGVQVQSVRQPVQIQSAAAQPVEIITDGQAVEIINGGEVVEIINSNGQAFEIISGGQPIEIITSQQPVEIITPGQPIEIQSVRQPVQIQSVQQPVEIITAQQPVPIIIASNAPIITESQVIGGVPINQLTVNPDIIVSNPQIDYVAAFLGGTTFEGQAKWYDNWLQVPGSCGYDLSARGGNQFIGLPLRLMPLSVDPNRFYTPNNQLCGQCALVRNIQNGASVKVLVVDTAFDDGYNVILSSPAFAQIGDSNDGFISVTYERTAC